MADRVRVQFPWGSLLTGLLTADQRTVSGIADLITPGGRLTVLLSVVERDGIEGIGPLDELTARRTAHRITAACDDLIVDRCRAATAADVAASHSSWAKRLGVGRGRIAWVLRFQKRGG